MNNAQYDKAIEYLMDATTDKLSNCCGAPVYEGGICSDCKEHCGQEEPWGINLGHELGGSHD